jgi:antitoxin component of MazEF toxin-antitoxin module
MITLTLRRRGSSVVVSLPRNILSLLDLDAGSAVGLAIEDGKVVLAPVRRRPTLAQGLEARAALERRLGQRLRDASADAASIGSRVPPRMANPPRVDSTSRRRRS